MQSERVSVVAGFTIIILVWSSTWYAIKLGLPTVPPFFGVAFRFTLASVVLYAMLRVRRLTLPFDRSAVQVYAILGLFSFSIPFGMVYWGEQYIPSGLASILFAVFPFIVAIGSHFLLPAERLNVYKASGILTGFFGLVVIFWSDLHWGGASIPGMASIVLSTALSGTALVLTKRSGTHLDPVAMNLGGMLFGVPVVYLIAFSIENAAEVRPDMAAIGSILYLGTFGTVLTFVIYYWLLKRVEAVYLSLVAMATPVLAVILGAVMLGESLSARTFIGGAFVLLGVLITNGREVKKVLMPNSDFGIRNKRNYES